MSLRELTTEELFFVSGGEQEDRYANALFDAIPDIFSSTPLNRGEPRISDIMDADRAYQVTLDVTAIYQGMGAADVNNGAGNQVGNDFGDPNGPSGGSQYA